jgi:6-phosphogluconolactonase
LLPASSVIVNQGSSVNENRQTRPHAHSIKFAPAENLVFSADLGTDQLDIFMLDDKKLQANEQKFVKMKPGAGPRHFDFDEKGEYIFVINELNSTISTIKKEGEKWTTIETVSTVPENFEGQNYCADIHVSDDGKFLYGSNRGHNSIVVFAVDDETKKLTLKGFAGVEGDWPRNFSLSPDGNHLLVANQRSGNITLFKINKETGIPEFTGKEIKIPEPVCIEFL